MKRIIMALAVAAIATVGQAAAFSWSTVGTIYSASDSSTALSSFTAYLSDSSTITQGDLLTALRNGGTITDYSALSTFTGSGKITTTRFDVSLSAGRSLSAYFVIVDGDNVYLSKTGSGAAQDVGTKAINFGNQSSPSKTVFDSDTAYSAAGWYGTAAVPEPTSAMLLVLGVAALALRRKRV